MKTMQIYTLFPKYNAEKHKKVTRRRKKHRSSANKCHFSENKRLLFRNKWHLLRKRKPRSGCVSSPYGLSGVLLPAVRSIAGKCQADSQ